jgi:hypothetical protein
MGHHADRAAGRVGGGVVCQTGLACAQLSDHGRADRGQVGWLGLGGTVAMDIIGLGGVMNPDVWLEEFPAAVTVCDADGVIIAMNQKAAAAFSAEGGKRLIGSSVLDCHPEPARSKLQHMMADRQANVYTIEKRGVRKLVFQSPWFLGGRYAGFVEVVMEIPSEIPHFVRPG